MPGELSRLITTQTNTKLSFFSHIRTSLTNNPVQTMKNMALTAAGTFSGYMYWPSSFQAARFGGESLQYIAALGGSVTNAIFNIESFLSLSELPDFRKIPFKYLSASVISVFCVLPNFLMNITDEEDNYIDNTDIALQGSVAILNVLVNVVGTSELIDNISTLCKKKTPKEKLMEKLDQTVANFLQLKSEKQTEANFKELLGEHFEKLTYRKCISNFSIKTGLAVFSFPQILAYSLISYFGMKEFTEKKWGMAEIESIALGSIVAIGNTIPSIGFSIKGLNSSYEKLISLEKPSLFVLLFIVPALFSGFTTHKAMADSLEKLDYSGNFAKILKWTANLGAALIYNLPQMASLANRLSEKKVFLEEVKDLKELLAEHFQAIDDKQARDFDHTNFKNQILKTTPFFIFFENETRSNQPTKQGEQCDECAPNVGRIAA